MIEGVFWASLGAVVYTYAVYPLLVTLLARLRPRPARSDARHEPAVSVIIPAWNEEGVIAAKIENSLGLDYPPEKLEVIVASDGSDDRTEEIARRYQGERVKVIAIRPRSGKPTAIARAVQRARGDVLLLTDANTMLARGALRHLVRHFADPVIGAVTGDVRLVDRRPGYGASEGVYYRYERHLQACESAIGSVVGVDGGMYAIRRALFRPPPEDTILDDFVISVETAIRGYRIVFDPGAIAWEDAPPDEDQEFRRKTRVLAGAWQCLRRGRAVPSLRTPGFFMMFVSHKLLRWLVPVFLLAMLGTSAALAARPLYAGLLAAQAGFYALAAVGALAGARAGRAASLAYYFCFANGAATAGMAKGLFGLQPVRWSKVGRTAAVAGAGRGGASGRAGGAPVEEVAS